MIHRFTYETVLGDVTLVEEDGALLAISLKSIQEGTEQETPIIKEAHRQITEYLKGERKVFDLPIRLRGTDFQQQVWTALLDIPYGET